MSDKTIDEVTPDTNVTGVEKLPVSDGGVPKSMTVEQVKDFVLTKINAIPASESIAVASDGVFIKKDGALKPTSATNVANAVISYAFGSDTAAALAGTDVIVLAKSGVAKKTTLADLAEYVKTASGFPTLDIHGLTELSSPVSGDEIPLYDSTGLSNKKATLANLGAAILSVFTDATTASSIAENDYLFVQTQNGVRRVLRSNAGMGSGDVTGPALSLDGEVAVFHGTTGKTIRRGHTVVTTPTSASTDSQLVTAKGVWDAIKNFIQFAGSAVAGKFVRVNSDGKIQGDIGLVTTIGPASGTGAATDTNVPSELAVRTAISDVSASKVTGPASCQNENIPIFDGTTGKVIKDGYEVINNFSGLDTTKKQLFSAAVTNSIRTSPTLPVSNVQPGSAGVAKLGEIICVYAGSGFVGTNGLFVCVNNTTDNLVWMRIPCEAE